MRRKIIPLVVGIAGGGMVAWFVWRGLVPPGGGKTWSGEWKIFGLAAGLLLHTLTRLTMGLLAEPATKAESTNQDDDESSERNTTTTDLSLLLALFGGSLVAWLIHSGVFNRAGERGSSLKDDLGLGLVAGVFIALFSSAILGLFSGQEATATESEAERQGRRKRRRTWIGIAAMSGVIGMGCGLWLYLDGERSMASWWATPLIFGTFAGPGFCLLALIKARWEA